MAPTAIGGKQLSACSVPAPPGQEPDLDLKQLIADQGVVCHFQPLLSMRSQALLGVKALCRRVYPQTGHLVPPQRLFGLAGQGPLLIDLDRLCRQ